MLIQLVEIECLPADKTLTQFKRNKKSLFLKWSGC